MSLRFRFRPRFGGLAWGAIALGVAALGLGAWRGTIGLPVAGGAGVVIGWLYLASPAWRYVVVVDDDALEVVRGTERRFRLPWTAIRRLLASPATETCFVDGGEPGKSLLVPGDGAPAPYDIEGRRALYRAIRTRVPPDRIEDTATLDGPR